MYTIDNISLLPFRDANFQEAKSDYLGQLIVTGEDGIPPKLLMETVEQISIAPARVFNLSLKEGLFQLKEANIIPLFKNGSRNK